MKSYKTTILGGLTILNTLCMATFCMAADVANPMGLAVAQFLTNTVFPILGALALGLVSWAAKTWGTKLHIEALTKDNNFLTSLAAQGVAYAEESAANMVKKSMPISGNDKLNKAVSYVLQMAPKVSEDQAKSLVTSALARLPDVGATGAKVTQ